VAPTATRALRQRASDSGFTCRGSCVSLSLLAILGEALHEPRHGIDCRVRLDRPAAHRRVARTFDDESPPSSTSHIARTRAAERRRSAGEANPIDGTHSTPHNPLVPSGIPARANAHHELGSRVRARPPNRRISPPPTTSHDRRQCESGPRRVMQQQLLGVVRRLASAVIRSAEPAEAAIASRFGAHPRSSG
jgi:hypothetical protein